MRMSEWRSIYSGDLMGSNFTSQDDYEQANIDFEQMRSIFLPEEDR